MQRTFPCTAGKERVLKCGLLQKNCLIQSLTALGGAALFMKRTRDLVYFYVTADVEVSNQFFGWICGFGRMAKIISPEPVVKKFEEFLDKIREMY